MTARTDDLHALAAEILAASGVDMQAMTEAEFLPIRYKLTHELMERAGLEYLPCMRVMNSEMGHALNGTKHEDRRKNNGGHRKGAGKPKLRKFAGELAGKDEQ